MTILEQIVIDTGGDPYGSGDKWRLYNVEEDGLHTFSNLDNGILQKTRADLYYKVKARLQNKPSFADHPDAKCFVQTESGGWWKNKHAVDVKPCYGLWSGSGEWEQVCSGRVFGDWRDTLEVRPIELQYDPDDVAFKFNESEAEGAVLFNGEIGGGREWRGPEDGLPPVGAFVDVTGYVQYGAGETNCEVVAHVENCAVIRMSYGLGCFESRALSPAKNERERVIQAAMQAGMRDGGYHLPVAFCEALYDAGMLVMPKQ